MHYIDEHGITWRYCFRTNGWVRMSPGSALEPPITVTAASDAISQLEATGERCRAYWNRMRKPAGTHLQLVVKR